MAATLHVLYIDDDLEDRVQVQRELSRAFPRVQVDWVADADAQVRAMDAGGFDVVITDFVLGWTNGLSVLREMKARHPECPVIMFTSGGNESVAVEGMKAGLDDYVIRSPAYRVRLVTAIQGALERGRARAAAREAEARYRELFSGVPVGLFRAGPDWRLLDANPVLVQMLALPSGSPWGDRDLTAFFADPADGERWRSRVVEAGIVRGFVARVQRPDGAVIWIRGAARAVRDAGGAVRFHEGELEDITESHAAEEALQKSRERLALALAAARLGAWEFDFGSGQFHDSETADRLLGFPPGTRCESEAAFFQKVHPDDRETVRQAMARATEAGDPYEAEFRAVWPDGSVHWLIGMGRVSRDEAGRPLGVSGVTLDVTERKRTTEAFRASEARFRRLIETATDAIFLADVETGILVEANRKASELTGLPVRQIVGMHLSQLHPPEEFDQAQRRYSEIVREATGGVISDLSLQGKGGRRIPVEIASSIVESDGRRLALGIFRDLSERQQLEEQVRHAQRLDAVGRLAGGVAHDFNNLLSAIVGFGQLARQRTDTVSPVGRYLDEILRAADRAAAITRQLLAFSRRQVLSLTVFDLKAVVNGLEAMIRRLTGERILLKIVHGPSTGGIRADAGQIEQVVLNLAINARDAMPEGGTLTIETGEVVLDAAAGRIAGLGPGDYMRLRVSDTGIGMDAETLAHIFEPFFTTREEGIGLGLSTVYGIVKQSGGGIHAESARGRGSRFDLYLPRVDRPQAHPSSGALPAVEPEGSETVLLVEDEQVVREMVREVLQGRGYTVLDAPDADGAADLAGRHAGPIPILLVDVGLPGTSGPDLARRLVSRRPEMRVLFISGYSDERLGAEVPGGGALLRKPFTPSDLSRRLREVLDGRPPPPA